MKRLKVIMALIGMLLISYAFAISRREPSLLEVSSRIYSPVMPELYTYQWNADERLIYVHSEVGRWTPTLFDLRTNTRKNIDTFAIPMTATANSPFADEPLPGGYVGVANNYAVSTDGRWLAWPVGSCFAAGWQTCSLNKSGANYRSAIRLNGVEQTIACIPNQNQWLCLSFHADKHYHALLQSYGSLPKLQDIPLNWPVGHVVLGCTSDYHLITTESGFEQQTDKSSATAKIYEAMLTDKNHLPLVHSIRFPVQATILEAVLSPSGKQIAWLLRSYRKIHRVAFAQYLLSHILHLDVDEAGMWISDIDGSHLHEIGHVSVNEAASKIDLSDTRPSFLDMPRFVRWQPDGQHLSYMYHDALYSVRTVR